MKFLPDTIGKRWGYVNLEEYCVRNNWNAKTGAMPISEIHKERGIDCSYGGYLEYRKTMLQGTYLDDGAKYLHLGVDFNTAELSEISLPCDVQVVLVDNDTPEPLGWGPRLIVKMFDRSRFDIIYMVFAHLDSILVERLSIGQVIRAGYVFAKVGMREYGNGGWWPHLHVQAMTQSTWDKYKDNLGALDGYGRLEDINELAREFPDPLPILLG